MSGGILLQDIPAAIEYTSPFIEIRGANEIEVAVSTYLGWNRLIDSSKYNGIEPVRVKAEHAYVELPKLLESWGLNAEVDKALNPRKDYNGRLHRQLRWVDVSRAVKKRDLYNNLKAISVEYAYAQK